MRIPNTEIAWRLSGEKANPIDTFRAPWYRLVILFWAVMLVFLWLVPRHGPDHPVYGLLLVSWTLFLGPALVDSVMRLPPRWFRVPQGERVLHRMLGVGIFGGLLERSGYNRAFVHPGWESRGYKAGTRGDLYFRARAAQCGSGAPYHIGRSRIFHRAPVGRIGSNVAGCSRSPLSGAAPALHVAPATAYVG